MAEVFPGWLVPDVIGMDSGSAATTLHGSGFQTIIVNGYEDDIAVILVCATHPRGGVYVPVGGSFVIVTVSNGPSRRSTRTNRPRFPTLYFLDLISNTKVCAAKCLFSRSTCSATATTGAAHAA